MKTVIVNALVHEVLDSLPKPYSMHVIEDAFCAIEGNSQWLNTYESQIEVMGKTVVNNSVGFWIGRILGKVGKQQVQSKKSKLVGSYSILDTDAKTVARKPKEQEARHLMADHYQANKLDLPQGVRQFREMIVELIMEGMSVQEAYAFVLSDSV